MTLIGSLGKVGPVSQLGGDFVLGPGMFLCMPTTFVYLSLLTTLVTFTVFPSLLNHSGLKTSTLV